MPILFVIGRAGTGKTRRCFTRIVDAMRADPLGPTILWLLPRQATFEAERKLVCESGLGAFTRTRVVSFQTLASDVLSECGGTAIPEVTALGRQMILGQLLRQHAHELTFFRSVATRPGLAAELDSTFAELERTGRDGASMAEMIDTLTTTRGHDPDAASLVAKLSDLHKIYTAYAAFLGQDRLDPHRRSAEVVATIEHCASLKNSAVFVDGFLDFTNHERQMLVALARAGASIEITLLMDSTSPTLRDPHTLPSEMSLFHRAEQTYRRLWFAFNEAGVVIEAPLVLSEAYRFTRPELTHVERAFDPTHPTTSTTSSGAPSDTQIQLIECASPRDEVEAAARAIKRFVARGVRLRGVSLLVRSLDDYADLIAAVFHEHDLPVFLDRRRSAAHHPLLQFIRAAFQIARDRWPHDAVMALLKTGLAGLSTDEADVLENYAVLHRIKHLAWSREAPWTFARKSTLQNDDGPDAPPPAGYIKAQEADALRRKLSGPLNPFIARLFERPTLNVKEIVVALFTMLDAFGVREAIVRSMDQAAARGRLEQRAEHEQVWSNVVDLFDQMTDLLGDQPLTVQEFCDVLETGLDQFDLALTPPTVDQIIVGQIDRTRTTDTRAAVILGLSEGQFPRLQREGSVLSDTDRRTLRRSSLDLESDTQRKLLDESLLAYLALTRASEYLVMTRPTTDGSGRPLAPSPFWNRVREILPHLTPEPGEPTGDAPSCIGTPRQLVTTLMKWARKPVDPALEPLYQWFTRHTCCDDAIDTMRYRAWRALSDSNSAELSEELSRTLFASPLHATVAQLESFANCPFQHFARHGLGLQERRDEDIGPGDLGQAYHQIMRRVIDEGWLSTLDEPDETALLDLLERSTTGVGQSLRGELLLSTSRNKYLLGRIQRTLEQVLAAHRAAGARGKFKPAFVDVRFGPRTPLPELSVVTHAGNKLLLSGRIDRVDLREGSPHAIVVDYKLSGGSLSLLDVYHGLSLQLLTSMIAIAQFGPQLAQRKLAPAGAFYIQMGRQLKKGDPKKAIAPDAETYNLSVKPRGIFGLQHLTSFDDKVRPSAMSDVVHARLNKDGTLGVRNNSDSVEPDELPRILSLAARKLRDLADQIISGRIEVKPYRIGRVSPCSRCGLKSVCRFEPTVNGYLHLPTKTRDEILTELKGDTK